MPCSIHANYFVKPKLLVTLKKRGFSHEANTYSITILLETYLSRSTLNQPGLILDSKCHTINISTRLNTPVLNDTQAKSKPGFIPQF